MEANNFLAFDIGASSGRALLISFREGHFEMREIHRFPNRMMELHGRYYWNLYHIYNDFPTFLLCLAVFARFLSSL